jgi:hypothetical protein
MKLRSLLLMIGVMVCIAVVATAQSQDDTRIKILRTEKPGIIKMVHAIRSDVHVQFTNHNGVVGEDKIKGEYPKGISRRYNLNRIYGDDFRMVITSERVRVTYHIIPSRDRQTFEAHLEKVEHKYQPVLANR